MIIALFYLQEQIKPKKYIWTVTVRLSHQNVDGKPQIFFSIILEARLIWYIYNHFLIIIF